MSKVSFEERNRPDVRGNYYAHRIITTYAERKFRSFWLDGVAPRKDCAEVLCFLDAVRIIVNFRPSGHLYQLEEVDAAGNVRAWQTTAALTSNFRPAVEDAKKDADPLGDSAKR